MKVEALFNSFTKNTGYHSATITLLLKMFAFVPHLADRISKYFPSQTIHKYLQPSHTTEKGG
jgi:hypothetical protein